MDGRWQENTNGAIERYEVGYGMAVGYQTVGRLIRSHVRMLWL